MKSFKFKQKNSNFRIFQEPLNEEININERL
jgi:hypothetical protein